MIVSIVTMVKTLERGLMIYWEDGEREGSQGAKTIISCDRNSTDVQNGVTGDAIWTHYVEGKTSK
jgi:hypothetical protein